MNQQELVVSNTETIETTLGELVEAFTQVAIEAGKSEREGYKLASIALENLLNRRGTRSDNDRGE
jgi:hypothetical protein